MYKICVLLSLQLLLSSLINAHIDPRLTTTLTLNTTLGGVSTTPEGRLFIILNHIDGSAPTPFISELGPNGTFIPYPDEEWNRAWNASDPSQDPNTHFVNPNAQRIGPDGRLWVLDRGTDVTNSKLVAFDLSNNTLARVYSLQNMSIAASTWDDVRFHGNLAYLTDTGAAAIGILDLTTGHQRTVLEYTQSTTSWFPASAEGEILKNSNGSYLYVHVDQLEVSPDGVWLYYHPLSGGFWRVPTVLLDQALYNDTIAAALEESVEPFAPVATTGGTAIDADGNIYSGNSDLNAITRTSPNGTVELILQDDRLLWVDAMWVDTQKRLWIPVNQLERSTLVGNGTSEIVKPLYVFTMDIGIGPSPIDHK